MVMLFILHAYICNCAPDLVICYFFLPIPQTTVSIKPITYSNAHGTTTTRAYDSSIPGRVMRMKAGGVYHVTLNNDHDLVKGN